MQSKTVIYSSILMLATTSLNGNATPLKPPAAAKYVAEPIIESQPVLSVEQDSEYRYPLFASDSDRDRLTWRFKDSNSQPSWLSLRPNAKVLTVAGNGETGSTDNSEPLNATYSTLWGIATDANGNVFTSEYYSYRIRQIALGHGAVSTVAGTGAQGTDDNNNPLSATFRNIRHLAHHNGILYITGNSSNKIRKIDLTNAVVTTLAGSGIAGNNDNPNPLLAQFDQPYGITVDPNGDIYISAGNLIRKIDGQTQAVTTYAGNGNSEHLDNPDPLKAGFSAPNGIVSDSVGNIYVTDGHSIRKIDATTGAVTTFAGSTSPGSSDNSDPLLASFNSPLSITVDSQDNLYVGDYANNKIRRIDKQTSAVTSYAGTGLEGSEDNNDGQLASFNFPTAIYADNKDNLWVADWLNNKVRKVEPSATLVGQPSNDAVGNNDVCMVVSDGNSDVEQCFTIEVINVNDRPTISATIINSVAEDSLYQLQVTGSDIDIDVGIDDVLSYDIINKPTWAEFDTSTGLLSGTPSNSDVGVTEGIVISVSDQAQLSASLDPFDLTVVNTNDAPIISGSPITAIDEGSPYLVVLNATDVDIGDRLTFTITNAPSWLTLDSQNGVLQGTPSRDDVGISENIILSVTDGIATTSLSPFNLEVLLVNDPPTLVANQSLEGPEDSVLTASILANDAQSDPLTFELAEPATHGQVSITGDIVSYTPNTNFYGNDSFALVAFDGFAYSQPQSFSVTVTPQDDPELAINDLIYLPTEAPEGGYVLDVLANDNIGVQIAGAFALKGKVIVEDGHLRLLPLSEQLPALTITYAVQDDLSNYAPAQVVVVFE